MHFARARSQCLTLFFKWRRWLKKHYYEDGTDHVRPVRVLFAEPRCLVVVADSARQFLLPFKWLNTHLGGLGNAPGAEVPHEHYVSGVPEAEWEQRVSAGAKRHLRLLRQPNVDPADSLVRDTRPIWQQVRLSLQLLSPPLTSPTSNSCCIAATRQRTAIRGMKSCSTIRIPSPSSDARTSSPFA